MAFGVFIHRSDSIYDDTPAERYQSPPQNLSRVRACIGNWIVYYEPRKVPSTRGYFAVAKVQQVIADPSVPGMYLALIEPGSYLDFSNPVPFADGDRAVIERGVLNEAGRISGRAQAAVRGLSASDFSRIVGLGLAEENPLLPRVGASEALSAVREERVPFGFDETRERVSMLVSRVVRDRVFRRIVLRAYDERCAVTGLKLINGGGRAEVEAAHIRPVEADGPDIVSDGLALSGRAHWMFNRGPTKGEEVSAQQRNLAGPPNYGAPPVPDRPRRVLHPDGFRKAVRGGIVRFAGPVNNQGHVDIRVHR